MPSAFENLCGPGKPLKAEPPDANEFAGLMRSGLARLTDAATPSLSLESRFDLGYNAAHALCFAALRWHGYRSSNRYIVFQPLPVEAGRLDKDGRGRGTRYRWPKQRRGDLFVDQTGSVPSSQHREPSSPHKADSSQHKPGEPQHSETLRALAELVRARRRTQPQALRHVILELCSTQPLSLAELSDLLGRAPASLQNHYLTPMLKDGVLQLMYPNHPNHPQQRYRVE